MPHSIYVISLLSNVIVNIKKRRKIIYVNVPNIFWNLCFWWSSMVTKIKRKFRRMAERTIWRMCAKHTGGQVTGRQNSYTIESNRVILNFFKAAAPLRSGKFFCAPPLWKFCNLGYGKGWVPRHPLHPLSAWTSAQSSDAQFYLLYNVPTYVLIFS